ncbi:serine acetyltransferase [Enterococcus larvae]|uniref:serine acetyltransferase n=1 Tax=Enterococcus larvae TaxID=2794352 RepID=UPI003F3FB1A0
MFYKLVKINCYARNKLLKKLAGNLLEKFYGCEINCMEIDPSTLFAHHARGCTIVASKVCANVVFYQNVTIGSNMKYNKVLHEWENVGNPIIGTGVVIADGAKILGPVIIGENTTIAAGAIITKSIPADSVAFGVNQFKPKNPDYELVFYPDMIAPEKIIEANLQLINEYEGKKD